MRMKNEQRNKRRRSRSLARKCREGKGTEVRHGEGRSFMKRKSGRKERRKNGLAGSTMEENEKQSNEQRGKRKEGTKAEIKSARGSQREIEKRRKACDGTAKKGEEI